MGKGTMWRHLPLPKTRQHADFFAPHSPMFLEDSTGQHRFKGFLLTSLVKMFGGGGFCGSLYVVDRVLEKKKEKKKKGNILKN